MEGSESIFSTLQPMQTDEVFRKLVKVRSLQSSDVINLIMGMYRTDEGKPHFFETARKIEKQHLEDDTVTKEYCTLTGMPDFLKCAQQLIFGEHRSQVISGQTLSGTGAVTQAVYILKELKFKKLWISEPTWFGHERIIKYYGLTPQLYPYYSNNKFQYEEMLECFKSLEKGSSILLQGGEHNPSGYDFSQEQWKEVGEVIKERQLFPVIDFAYQGLGSGDLDEDAWGVRSLYDQGIEMIVCQSFSKNFSFYNERVGAIHFVIKSEAVRPVIQSNLADFARSVINQPPMHGANIVARVLSDPELKKEWKEEVKGVAMSIKERRQKLRDTIEALDVPGDWSCITEQRGMFALLPLTLEQVQQLEDKHLFMLSNARISVGSLPLSKIGSVAERIAAVLKSQWASN